MLDRTKRYVATPGVALIIASMLAGCANSFSQRRVDAAGESRRLVAEAIEPGEDMRPVLTERPDDPIRVRAIVATPESGEVSVAAAGVRPLSPLPGA